MRKKLIPILGLLAIIAFSAMTCKPSQQTVTYNTLSSIQVSTAGAYSAYLDLVITGKLATNSVPVVSRDYTLFQTAWNAAVSVASMGLETPATQPVTDAAIKVVADITVAKGGAK
jgi:hypothetical protein